VLGESERVFDVDAEIYPDSAEIRKTPLPTDRKAILLHS